MPEQEQNPGQERSLARNAVERDKLARPAGFSVFHEHAIAVTARERS